MGYVLEVVQRPATLINRLVEYPKYPKLFQVEYDRKLQTWIDNSWLLLYSEGEIGSPQRSNFTDSHTAREEVETLTGHGLPQAQ